MMKTPSLIIRCLLLAFFLVAFPVLSDAQSPETVKQITSALSAGNAQGIADHFNSMVDLTLPGTEDNFGKTQALRILMDFFAKNPVKSYKTTKQGSSNDGSQFTIGRLEAGTKIYRVYYLLKKTGDKYLIHQFQIQEEN